MGVFGDFGRGQGSDLGAQKTVVGPGSKTKTIKIVLAIVRAKYAMGFCLTCHLVCSPQKGLQRAARWKTVGDGVRAPRLGEDLCQ